MVIHDEQCREYAEGWNACNAGKDRLVNPYSCLGDATQYYCWQRGFDDCQLKWDHGNDPKDIPVRSGMPSAINGYGGTPEEVLALLNEKDDRILELESFIENLKQYDIGEVLPNHVVEEFSRILPKF